MFVDVVQIFKRPAFFGSSLSPACVVIRAAQTKSQYFVKVSLVLGPEDVTLSILGEFVLGLDGEYINVCRCSLNIQMSNAFW